MSGLHPRPWTAARGTVTDAVGAVVAEGLGESAEMIVEIANDATEGAAHQVEAGYLEMMVACADVNTAHERGELGTWCARGEGPTVVGGGS